jgi:tetratricopeptide (TPR) repeat protein
MLEESSATPWLKSTMKTRNGFLLILLSFSLPALGQESPQDHINQLFSSAHQNLESSELERAESDFREAAGLSLDQLGTIYAALQNFDPAERAYKESIRASFASAAPQMGLGILYLRLGEVEKGKEIAGRILAVNPLHAGALHLRGKLNLISGDLGAASTDLSDAYQVNPKDISIAYTLAVSYLQQTKLEEAQQVFSAMIRTFGDGARLRTLIGRAYRDSGLPMQAEEQFEKAVELDPGFRSANFYRIMTLLEQDAGEGYPEAIREFEVRMKESPDDYFVNFFLGVLYYLTLDYEKAVPRLHKAASLRPDNPDPYLYLGQSLGELGQLPEAVEVLKKSIELTQDPSRNSFQVGNAYYSVGRTLIRLGQREEAQAYLDKSQELKTQSVVVDSDSIEARQDGALSAVDSIAEDMLAPEDGLETILKVPEPDEEAKVVLRNTIPFYRAAAANAYQGLARIATQQGQLAKAADFLEKGAFWDPTVPDLQFNLAVARLKADDLSGTVDPLIDVLRREPEKTEAKNILANLAIELTGRGQREAAFRAVSFLLETDPMVPDLYLLKGRLYAQEGNFSEALEAFQKALDISPDLPEVYYHRGRLLIREAEFDSALQELEEELKRDPNHAGALYHKGFVLVSQRDYDRAVPILLRVIQLQPEYADAYFQLGKAQIEQDQLLMAVANFETAAYLNPNASHILYQLSRAYQRAGREEDAARVFEKYRTAKKAEEEARTVRLRQPEEKH